MASNPKFDNKGFMMDAPARRDGRAANPNAPVMVGKIQVGSDLLEQLIDAMNSGEEVAIELAAWQSNNKEGVLNLKASLAKPRDAQVTAGIRANPAAPTRRAPPGGYRGRPAPDAAAEEREIARSYGRVQANKARGGGFTPPFEGYERPAARPDRGPRDGPSEAYAGQNEYEDDLDDDIPF